MFCGILEDLRSSVFGKRYINITYMSNLSVQEREGHASALLIYLKNAFYKT